MDNPKYPVHIDLEKLKRNNLVCDEKSLIHQRQFLEVCRIIKMRMDAWNDYDPTKKMVSMNEVISIFARRGAGKTTFVKSLKSILHKSENKCHGVECDNLMYVEVIEPNQIQKKENFMIRFLASIHDVFSEAINKKSEEDQVRFERVTNRIYEALPVIDGVGKLSMYADWDDSEYVADRFMSLAIKAKDLEKRFHEYLATALELVKKKALLFVLDDCDVNIEKTFEILETIRLFFTSPQVIVVMTGESSLYGMTVRRNYWKFFDKEFLDKECGDGAEERKRVEYKKMVNRLETQYLQKMIKPECRIALDNLFEKYQSNRFVTNKDERYSVNVEFSNGRKEELTNIYREILLMLGLTYSNQTDVNIYVDHLLKQPFRNQYRLLSVYNDWLLTINKQVPNVQELSATEKQELTDKLQKVFEVYINQFSSDNKHLMSKTPIYAAWILKFLIDNKILATGSQMLPNMENESLNNALFALGASCSRQVQNNCSIAFDFWVRVSFVRQALLALGEDGTKLNDFAHLYYDMGLCKILGNVHAYVNAEMNIIPNMRVVASEKNKMCGVNVLDKPILLKNGTFKKKLVDLVQLITVASDSRVTYLVSFYKIFSALAELIRSVDGVSDKQTSYFIENDFFYNTKDVRQTVLRDRFEHLSQIHTYMEPYVLRTDRNLIRQNVNERKLFNEPLNTESVFFYDLDKWIGRINDTKKIAIYNLDRIFSRMYYTLKGAESEVESTYNTIANELSNYVLAFWNACIIEYSIVNQCINNIQLNHEGDIARLFVTNYKAFSRNVKNRDMETSFVDWIIACPLMRCYVDPEVLMIIADPSIEWNVFDIKRKMRNLKFIKKELTKIEEKIEKYNDNIKEITIKRQQIIEAQAQKRYKTILEEELNKKDLDIKEKEKLNNEIKQIDLLLLHLEPTETLEKLEDSHRHGKMMRVRYQAQKNDLEKELAEIEKCSKDINSKKIKEYSIIPYNVYDELTNQML